MAALIGASSTNATANTSRRTPPARAAGSTGPCACDPAVAGPVRTPQGKLILNRASPEALMKLPGIGHKRAKAIVALRNRLGRFRRLADLLRIKGIGFRSLRKLKPLVVLDAPRGTKP